MVNPSAARPPFDVVAIDNQDVIRAGLVSLQLSHPNVVRSIRTFASVQDLDLTQPPAHVVVLDYWLGRDDHSAVPDIVRLKTWGAHVIMYTSEESPVRLQDALRAGLDGLCLKNDGLPALVAAINDVGLGQPVYSGPLARAALKDDALGAKLTPKEIDVLRLLALGLSAQEMAVASHVEVSTVRTQIESIRRKYAELAGSKVNSVRIVYEAARDGYVDPAFPRSPENP